MKLDLLRRTKIGSYLIDHIYNLKEDAKQFFFQRIIRHHPKITMRGSDEYRQGLVDLIMAASPKSSSPLTMVEIGSYRGESAEMFLNTGRVSQIYCIDPWMPFYDKTDMAAFTDMKSVEDDFDTRFRNDPRVIKIKGTIDDFSPSANIDLVYIDGCHTLEATQHDIDVSLQKLRPRVAISGHDYLDGSGVKTAVDNTFGNPDRVFSDSSWIHFFQ